MKYIYTKPVCFRALSPDETKFIDVNQNDVVEHVYGEIYKRGYDSLKISNKSIKEYFERYFSEKEIKYYTALRNKAAIEAMSGLMSDMSDVKRNWEKRGENSQNETPQEYLALRALTYANALVNKMIKHPWSYEENC